jgi:ABC-type phosphate transport system permease subunit
MSFVAIIAVVWGLPLALGMTVYFACKASKRFKAAVVKILV